MIATYVDTRTFTVATDRTSEFNNGRRVRAYCGVDGYKYGTVSGSSFSTNTEVVLYEDVLTSNLESVLYGIVSAGPTGSLPVHVHDGYDEGGATISGTGGSSDVQTFLDLTDTPTTYSGASGKYLRTTTSGIEFVDVETSSGQTVSTAGVQSIKVEYKSTDELYFGKGIVDINDSIYTLDSRISKQLTVSGTPSTGHYVYVSAPVSGSALSADNFTTSTGIPTVDYDKLGWYNGNDRCIGWFFVNSSGEIRKFLVGAGIYKHGSNLQIYSGTPSNTWTTGTIKGPTYVDIVNVNCACNAYDTGGQFQIRDKDTQQATGVLQVNSNSQRSYNEVLVSLDSNNQFEFRWNNSGNNNVNISETAYVLPQEIYNTPSFVTVSGAGGGSTTCSISVEGEARGIQSIKMEYATASGVYLNAGIVDIKGSLYEHSSREYVDAGLTGSDGPGIWYVYATVSGTDLNFTTSSGIPSVDYTYNGWYKGNDRCIGSVFVDTGGNIRLFRENNRFHFWPRDFIIINAQDIDNTHVTVDFWGPVYTKIVQADFHMDTYDNDGSLFYRPKDIVTDEWDMLQCNTHARLDHNTALVVCNSNQEGEIRFSGGGTNTFSVFQHGYIVDDYIYTGPASRAEITISGCGGTTSGTLLQDGSTPLTGDWNYGSYTISGAGDIYCNDIYTASGTVYIGDLKLSTDGTNLLVNDSAIQAEGGVTTFSGLSDTPTDYGTSGQILTSTGSGIEFSDYSINSVESDFYGLELVAEYNFNNETVSGTLSWDGETDSYIRIEVNGDIGTGKLHLNGDTGNNYQEGRVSHDGSSANVGDATRPGVLLSSAQGNESWAIVEGNLKNNGSYRLFSSVLAKYDSTNTDSIINCRATYWENNVDDVTSITFSSDDPTTGTIKVFRRANISLPVSGETSQTTGATVYRSTTQSLSTGSSEALSWDSVVVDSENYWNASNPTRLTAPSDGWYLITAGFDCSPGASSYANLYLRRNNNDILASVKIDVNSNGDGRNISSVYYLNAGDYVEALATIGSNTTTQAATSTNIFRNGASMAKIAVGSGTSDVQSFTDLDDTPTTYSGHVGEFLQVTASGLEFVDFYEKGTWTPTSADAASGGNTGTTGTGEYIKIGDQITVWATIANINTSGMTSGNVFYIQGLPYTSTSSYLAQGAVAADRIDVGGSAYNLCCETQNSNAVFLRYSNDNLGDSTVKVSELISTQADIRLTLTYNTGI